MTLFTKPGCKKCQWIKELFDLKAMGIVVEVLDNADALGHLAWHELVAESEISLPILVLDDCSVITTAIKIKQYLEGIL